MHLEPGTKIVLKSLEEVIPGNYGRDCYFPHHEDIAHLFDGETLCTVRHVLKCKTAHGERTFFTVEEEFNKATVEDRDQEVSEAVLEAALAMGSPIKLEPSWIQEVL